MWLMCHTSRMSHMHRASPAPHAHRHALPAPHACCRRRSHRASQALARHLPLAAPAAPGRGLRAWPRRAWRRHADRKSTRLNSSHSQISYAVFCLKKKKKIQITRKHNTRLNYTNRHRANVSIFMTQKNRTSTPHKEKSKTDLSHIITVLIAKNQ